jgi:N-acetylglucosaminyldiphosphoundecaprenol N-acetyl-beta-D-mannosaminyltransferase
LFPGINIVGVHHGYFTDHEKVVDQINKAQPDILLVAMGMGKQEKWIWEHKESLLCPVCIGVGGSLDVIAGNLKRAPKWMQKLGLEWFFRLIQEPSRLGRIIGIPKFLIKEMVRKKGH